MMIVFVVLNYFLSVTDCRIAFIFVSFYHICPGVIAFFDSSCKTFQLSVEEQRLTPSSGESGLPVVWSFRRELPEKVCFLFLLQLVLEKLRFYTCIIRNWFSLRLLVVILLWVSHNRCSFKNTQ